MVELNSSRRKARIILSYINKAVAEDSDDSKLCNYLMQAVIHVQGYDTWGTFKLIGSKNKNHPDETDVQGAIKFYESLI